MQDAGGEGEDALADACADAGRNVAVVIYAELITLAVAQILLQCHSERRFLRLAGRLLG